MEALKTQKNASMPDQVSEMDRRLEAIKEILVGNQIERLDQKYKGLNQRMESTSAHLIGLVDDLSKELVKLKKEQEKSLQQERKERFKENDALRENLQEVSNTARQDSASEPIQSEKALRMARRVEELESLAHAFADKQKQMANKLRSEWKKDLSQRMEKQDEENKAGRENLQSNLQERLKNLEEKLEEKLSSQENKAEKQIHHNRSKLQDLAKTVLDHQKYTEEELKQFRSELNEKGKSTPEQEQKIRAELEDIKNYNTSFQTKTEREIADIQKALYQNQNQQSELESELTQVMEKLASKVSQRLSKNDEEIKNLSKLLDDSNKALAEAHHNHDKRIRENEEASREMHQFLENELVPHLQASKKDRQEIDQKLDDMQNHFDQKLREVSARMEGRMDGMIKMKEQGEQKEQQSWKARKNHIKGTLEKLSQLLDD